jgi:hypothetical protein
MLQKWLHWAQPLLDAHRMRRGLLQLQSMENQPTSMSTVTCATKMILS